MTHTASHTPARGSGRGGVRRSACKSSAKRQRLPGHLSVNDYRRLARRAGVKRIAAGCYDIHTGVPAALKEWLSGVIGELVTIVEYARRHTVIANDVGMVLKRRGRPLYMMGVDPTYGTYAEFKLRVRKKVTKPLLAEELAAAAAARARQEAAAAPAQQQEEAEPAGREMEHGAGLLPVLEEEEAEAAGSQEQEMEVVGSQQEEAEEMEMSCMAPASAWSSARCADRATAGTPVVEKQQAAAAVRAQLAQAAAELDAQRAEREAQQAAEAKAAAEKKREQEAQLAAAAAKAAEERKAQQAAQLAAAKAKATEEQKARLAAAEAKAAAERAEQERAAQQAAAAEAERAEQQAAVPAAAAASALLSPQAQRPVSAVWEACAATKGDEQELPSAAAGERRLSVVPTPVCQPMSLERSREIQGWLHEVLTGPLFQEGCINRHHVKKVMLARNACSWGEVQDVLFALERRGDIMVDGDDIYICV